MTTKRIMSPVQMGIGSVAQVGSACMSFVDDPSGLSDDIRTAAVRLGNLLAMPETVHIAKRIAAAVLNSEFYKEGRLFTVDADGKLGIEFITSNNGRRTIATMGFPDQIDD